MPTVPGVDVAYWDSGIDWPKVRATGQRFVLVKATEGETYSDPTFNDNWSGSKSAGLLRGAYCYFHPNMDPQKQAAHFISAVQARNDKGELPHALDLETADGMSAAQIITNAKVWLDQVEQAFGRKPFIYSSVSFLGISFSIVGGGPPVWAKDYPLWLAWYPNQYTDGMTPLMPRGWYNWTVWQYSQAGAVNGINAKVDLDVFNGSLDDLYKFAGVQSSAQQTPTSYAVAAGDSFETIANKYGVTVRELVAANPQLIKPGDKLTIPVPVAIPQASGIGAGSGSGSGTSSTTTYTVKAGDSLTAIAIKYGVTIPAIVSANNLANPNSISVGQVLTIPKNS
jgi:lysozyme